MTAAQKLKAIKSIIFHKEMPENERRFRQARKAHLIAVTQMAQTVSYYLSTSETSPFRNSMNQEELEDLEAFLREQPTEAF